MAVRVYLDEKFELGQRLQLPAEEWHYIKNVRREQSEIQIFNRLGQLAKASLDGRQVVIDSWIAQAPRKSETSISLAVGLPESRLLKQIVRQASELGVRELIFFAADRSQSAKKRLSEISKLDKISIESMRQSERVRPLILRASLLEEVLEPEPQQAIFVLDEDPEADLLKLSDLPKSIGEKTAVALIIGPEGGWSVRERESFIKKQIPRLHLPAPILRVDTAVIAAIMAALYSFELRHLNGSWG